MVQLESQAGSVMTASSYKNPEISNLGGQSVEMNILVTELDPAVESSAVAEETEHANVPDVKFSSEEIRRLYKRFLRMDANKDGSLDIEELLQVAPHAKDNPLASVLLNLFDADGNGRVDFEEFIQGLTVFASCDNEAKLQFVFRIYDTDKDGRISNGDLFRAIRIMTGENLEDTPLQQIVDKTMREADIDHDGYLSFDAFKTFVRKKGVHLSSQNLNISDV